MSLTLYHSTTLTTGAKNRESVRERRIAEYPEPIDKPVPLEYSLLSLPASDTTPSATATLVSGGAGDIDPDLSVVDVTVVLPAAQVGVTRRHSVHICLVLDVSYSMNDRAQMKTADGSEQASLGYTLLDLVKQGARTVVESLDEGDFLSIVEYASNAKLDLDPTRMDSDGKVSAMLWCNSSVLAPHLSTLPLSTTSQPSWPTPSIHQYTQTLTLTPHPPPPRRVFAPSTSAHGV